MNNREITEIKKKEAEQKQKRNKTNLKTKQMIIIAGAFVSPSVVFFHTIVMPMLPHYYLEYEYIAEQ